MNHILTLLLVLGGTAALSWPLGRYLTHAMQNGKTPLSRGMEPQTWRQYLAAMIVLNALMFLIAFAVLFAQQWLPLNPDANPHISCSDRIGPKTGCEASRRTSALKS